LQIGVVFELGDRPCRGGDDSSGRDGSA